MVSQGMMPPELFVAIIRRRNFLRGVPRMWVYLFGARIMIWKFLLDVLTIWNFLTTVVVLRKILITVVVLRKILITVVVLRKIHITVMVMRNFLAAVRVMGQSHNVVQGIWTSPMTDRGIGTSHGAVKRLWIVAPTRNLQEMLVETTGRILIATAPYRAVLQR
jgi:hypothetical protein